MQSIQQTIASDLAVTEKQVAAAISLLDEGATVPFIARYRKEKTGGLDDTQLRNLEERLYYLRELSERKNAVLAAIDEQGKLTPELKNLILAAETKTRVEDLYLPYKKKRVTKAQLAKEAGIEPFAIQLLENIVIDIDAEAGKYINKEKGYNDTSQVLDGARQILMERFSEDADLIQKLRQFLESNGLLQSKVIDGKERGGEKFRDYFDFAEKCSQIPSHRALAMFRGRNEGVLQLSVVATVEDTTDPCLGLIYNHLDLKDSILTENKWLADTIRMAWRVKLLTRLDTDIKSSIKQSAEEVAINVFAENLKDLLLSSPAGEKAILGLDPGIRTGVKVAAINKTGAVITTTTIYPHQPQNKWDESIETLQKIVNEHSIEIIAIGNGTASRETEQLVKDLKKRYPQQQFNSIIVSEAGASVYSASEIAAKEFPDLDVSLRGAVSIARRLQDPLAELVKIDPKSIGVGQYQHDVNQSKLGRSLDATTEDCVNGVGVDLNTASAKLLENVSGLNATTASNIIEFRNSNGSFKNRNELKKVARLGDKAFEQCAGFLKIRNGDNPLDNSAVHPESYTVAEKIAASRNTAITNIIGNKEILNSIDPKEFVDDNFGLPTVVDILKELEKPGRDPRPEFKTAAFKEGVDKIEDLKTGMKLEGVITNVTNFGAFVDIGVHQDGLVHISQIADKFVKDPRDIVKTGEIVNVTVTELDIPRKRISLSMKSQATLESDKQKPVKDQAKAQKRTGKINKPANVKPANNAFAAAFAKAGMKK